MILASAQVGSDMDQKITGSLIVNQLLMDTNPDDAAFDICYPKSLYSWFEKKGSKGPPASHKSCEVKIAKLHKPLSWNKLNEELLLDFLFFLNKRILLNN